jgi:hypothetical protein
LLALDAGVAAFCRLQAGLRVAFGILFAFLEEASGADFNVVFIGEGKLDQLRNRLTTPRTLGHAEYLLIKLCD